MGGDEEDEIKMNEGKIVNLMGGDKDKYKGKIINLIKMN